MKISICEYHKKHFITEKTKFCTLIPGSEHFMEQLAHEVEIFWKENLTCNRKWGNNAHQTFEILLEGDLLPSGRFLPMLAKSGTRRPSSVLKLAKGESWASLRGNGELLGRSSSSKSTAVGLTFKAGEVREAS